MALFLGIGPSGDSDLMRASEHVNSNGRVIVEDGAYAGIRAVPKQGSHNRPLTICAGAVVGLRAVAKEVRPHATVIRYPAKLVEK
jgi:hypothetical protein